MRFCFWTPLPEFLRNNNPFQEELRDVTISFRLVNAKALELVRSAGALQRTMTSSIGACAQIQHQRQVSRRQRRTPNSMASSVREETDGRRAR